MAADSANGHAAVIADDLAAVGAHGLALHSMEMIAEIREDMAGEEEGERDAKEIKMHRGWADKRFVV